ncbi:MULTISPECIES: aspartate aminotransferase family protein [unclassified Hyphomicrobium]|uniref:aspartate aminotransferase family protein n=1 Tax=unclassified Hyphomicrobium TaxID=2619925 RepID=UPI000213DD80|nr:MULTISPECIES: aminotransferase class III-fold pyridoxal phosphate-dependent enzyme [unclassified Hyphomicrobium]CCB66995.1 Alanine--glyoxylate aminotransferase 2-like 1 [Hyphomicrobium sp. MC1]
MEVTKKILELNAFDMNAAAGLSPEVVTLIGRRRATFGPTSMLFYEKPLNLVRGEGVWLHDADGTRYLDAYNNVPSVGHCHPRIVEAVARQMGTLNTHTRYLYSNVYTYAERLLGTMPAAVSNIVFTCTGSESADFALRVARAVTGGTGFIVTDNAYHGNTSAVTEISPSSASAEPRPPYVFVVPAPDTYREISEAVGRRLARDVRTAIAKMNAIGIRFAGFIADSIFSSDGVFPGEPGFLRETLEAVHAAGGVYIADEVQPGFGRTGEKMWGFDRHGLVPDMVIMGKPMGNGFPMGGVAIKPDLLKTFGETSGYFNTFGGNPVAAAAGIAVLDVLKDEGLQQNSFETGAYLRSEIRIAGSEGGCIGDVRGAGLYIGVDIVKDTQTHEPDRDTAEKIVNGMRDRNILIGIAGGHGNVLKIRPPLCFNREHADIFLDGLRGALADAS